jgi:molybdate transport system substrate-binding protein
MMRALHIAVWLIATSLLQPTYANAVELKVLCAVAMKWSLEELTPAFEKATGHKVSATFATAGAVRDKIRNGEAFDVAVLPTPFMDPLAAQGAIASQSVVVWARSLVSVGGRAGARKPDISTVAGFKKAMLEARAISYADPAQGGGSGIQVAKVLQALGIAEEMKPKTRLVPGPESADLVAKGEADYALANTPLFVGKPGVDLIGSIPSELYDVRDFAFKIGLAANTKEADAANALIKHLTAPEAAPILKRRGIEPGSG